MIKFLANVGTGFLFLLCFCAGICAIIAIALVAVPVACFIILVAIAWFVGAVYRGEL